MGFGMLSALAKIGSAPEASSKNVTKIILTIVFFMFFSYGEFFDFSKVNFSGIPDGNLLHGTRPRITPRQRRAVGQNRRCSRRKQQKRNQDNPENGFLHVFLLW
jgi:hypothetical protein